MAEKNIFAHKLFFSLNISDFNLFFTWKLQPPWKMSPPLSQQPPSESWGPVSPPILFENFNPPIQWKGERGEHYVIVRNYFCNVLFKVLIKIESTVNTPADFILPVLWLDYEKQPPEVFYKKAVLKNFAISTGNMCQNLFFLWILRNF